jgi:hypothetical protein
MSKTARYLVGLLGVLAVLLVLWALWSIVGSPYLQAQRSINQSKMDITKLERETEDLADRMKRKDVLMKRSLPGDYDFAKQEYERALTNILTDCGLAGSYSLNSPKDNFVQDPKKEPPASRELQVTITMTKVDIGTLSKFLERYYKLNLLHQISLITITRTDSGTTRKGEKDNRKDLNVTIKSDALMILGNDRRTLISIPEAQVAVLGGIGYGHLQTNRYAARGVKPLEIERVLADPNRDYALLTYRDVFHGKLLPPDYVEVKPKDSEPPKPLLPDLSPFIKITSLIRQSTGSATLTFYDAANNHDYEVRLVQKGEKLEVTTAKLKVDIQIGRRSPVKEYTSGNTLTISHEGFRTKRSFRVHGLIGNMLVVSEKPSLEASPSKDTRPPGGGRPLFGGGKPPATPLPKPDPRAAFLGGVIAAGPKPDLVYLWEVGQPMNRLKELTAEEGKLAVDMASQGLYANENATFPPPKGSVTTPPTKAELPSNLELAPMPRLIIPLE